ncbi:MAG: hypothetical protein P4L33_06050 [Capsulimonadaceae bacterium]|nr:hypothetical protein [Capsulimonadaceae bacterium]
MSTSTLDKYLASCEPNYSEQHHMLGGPLHSPGYHTTLPDGIWAHDTRGALDYALALFASHDPAYVRRGQDVVDAILDQQDTDPTSRTYGIWSWYLEEPLDKMSPPDWNWADFCGARLADILMAYSPLLPDGQIQRIRTALGHAGWSIFRRNVNCDYTNIAIMGAAVTLAAGEILGESRLLDYGRLRLQRQLEHVRYHGGFTEYNSPTYSVVAVEELERIHRLVKDPEARATAKLLHEQAWKVIAEHFHPGTNQWAGPCSRAYSDWLSPQTLAFLSARVGAQLPSRDRDAQAEILSAASAGDIVMCPEDLRPLFSSWTGPDRVVRSRFVRREPDGNSTYGTTWMSADACLGSVTADILWTQRRALLGYWRTGEDPAVCLRMRFLHDGKDFSSAFVRNAQDGPRVLSLTGFILGNGDFHPSLDRPKDDTFRASDFRLRYELLGKGAKVRQIEDRRFEMAAGGIRAVVHGGDGWFNGKPVQWETSATDDGVRVDAICYAGPESSFRFASLERSVVASAVEILKSGEVPTAERPSLTTENAHATTTWDAATSLTITGPATPNGGKG